MKRILCCATVVGILLVAVSLAGAAVVTFQPRISGNEEYTDNTFLSEKHKVAEYITTITPGATFGITGKRYGIQATYDAGYAMYSQNTSNDTWRHNASLSAWDDLSKNLTLNIQDSFLKTNEPTTEEQYYFSGYQVGNTVYGNIEKGFRVGRSQYTVNSTDARLTYQFGEKDQVVLNYLFSFRNESNTNPNDNQEHRPSAHLTYWFTPWTGMDASATYTRGLFKRSSDFNDIKGDFRLNQKLTRHTQIYAQYEQIFRQYDNAGTQTDAGVQRDYRIYKPSIGVSIQPEKDVLISLGVGYFIQHQDNAGNNNGFTLDATASKKWTFRRGSVQLAALSGLDRNEFGTQNLGLERYYGVSLNAGYALSRKMNTNFNTSYRRNDYINSTNNRMDYQIILGGGLRYQMLRWLFFNLDYTHRLLRSDEATRKYDENRVTFSVTLTPEHPYRL